MRQPTTADFRRVFAGAIGKTEREGLERARLGKFVPGGVITDVPNQPGKVYIRLYRNGGISLKTARCLGVPLRASSTNDKENDIWVKIDPKTAEYVVERRVEIVDEDLPVAPLTVPRHRHNIGSGNEDPVEGGRFLPGLVHKKDADTLVVRVRSFTYKTSTGYGRFASSDFDLEPYLPTTPYYHAWVIVGFDPATVELVAVTGTEYPRTDELTTALIEDITFPYISLAAVKLKTGQTKSPDYRDIEDLRNWFGTTIPIIYAPTNAKYWVSEANSVLSAEVDLGALESGLIYNTVTTGVAAPSKATSAQVVAAIDDGDIPAAKIAANSLTATQIAPDAIGSSELADNAVDTAAIQDDAVTAAKIAANAVDTAAIQNDAVTADKIATNAVGSSELADNAVDTNAIQNAAVTSAKIATDLSSKNITDFLNFTNASEPSTPASNKSSVYLEDDGIFQELKLKDDTGLAIGLMPHFARVRNTSGSTIAAGKIVKLQSAGSGYPLIELATSATYGSSIGNLALTLESIPNATNGRVLLRGLVSTDTSSVLVGGTAYLTTNGNYNGVAPAISRIVGYVLVISNPGLLLFAPQSTASAMPDATYLVKTVTDATYQPNVFAMGSLATGLVKNTTTTGQPSIAVSGTDYVAPNSGANVINANMITDANVTDAKIATMTATKLRGTANRIIQTLGTGTPAEEIGGTATGDLLNWNGTKWDNARPGFGEMVTLAITGTVGSITLSSLGNLNGDFDHLLLILQLRSDRAAATRDGLTIQFNADTSSANYISLSTQISHSAALTTTENLTSTYTGGHIANAIGGSGAGAGHFPVLKVFIPNYRSGVHKVVRWDGYSQVATTTGNVVIYQGGFTWLGNSAITSIKFQPEFGANFAASSTYSLYGIG